jgi:general secretion pathway protein L
MADWLLLRMPRDGDGEPAWAAADNRGQLRTAVVRGSLEGLAAAAAGRRVALIVPGSDVLQLQAVLPAGNEARLALVAPYALEDQVAEDIEALHFAIGPRPGSDVPTPVDVVGRALLDRWLADARGWGVDPVAVFADSELVPSLSGHVTALLEGSSLTLRTEGARPLVLPADDVGLALDLALRQYGLDAATTPLVVYTTAGDWQQHQEATEALRPRVASLKVQLVGGGILGLLAQELPQSGAINLLQGDYRARSTSGTGFARWRVAAALALAAFAVQAGSQLFELQRLRREERAVDAAIEQVFRESMAGEQNATNARRRMELRLAGLARGAPTQGELLPLLGALSTAKGTVPGSRIDSLSFRRGTLDLRMTAQDAASLEKINQALRGGGLTAEVTSGSVKGMAYEGRLQLRSAGS